MRKFYMAQRWIMTPPRSNAILVFIILLCRQLMKEYMRTFYLVNSVVQYLLKVKYNYKMQQNASNPAPPPQTPTPTPTKANTRIVALLRNPKCNTFTSDYIIQLITRDSLLKIEQFMRKTKVLAITGFMRFFRELLPFQRAQTSQEVEFYLLYGLFKLFMEICSSKKKTEISFSDISSHIAEKMPNFTQQSIIQEKLLPLGLNIDQSHKMHIMPPEIYGQILDDRCFLSQRPIRSDRIQHLSREVGQAEYSQKFKLYFSIDKPSTIISILDDNFNQVHTLQTEIQMTKRDMVVNYIAWSDWQQKIACILGNYSLSFWSKQDNYKYEVNVPLPHQYLANPFTMIKYMASMKKWITLDNRPAIYVLDNRNYEPQYMFINQKIRKKKESEKFLLAELNYVQLLCIGFQRNLFLVSLKNKEIVSEVHNFRTAITSLAFSESYQALFVSTYQNFFRSYELSQFQDLMQRGKFQGHKSQISLLGVIQKKPIVFSLQQNSMLKMFDMRDYNCYQSVSVLKNIIYKQVLYLEDAICLIGSKMHVYGIQKQLTYQQKQHVIYLGTMHKDLLVVTNKNIRIYDIRNGALKSVVKPIFSTSEASSDIFSVYNIHAKQKLLIQSQQGQCIILETKQMSEIEKWKLDPKPKYMHFDQENDLLTQISLGNVNINQFHNEFCQKELRRQITNSRDVVRLAKISVKHDLIALCYEEDQSLYFYAYEKGKMLGYLNMGPKRVIKFKNAYKPHRNIHRFIDLQFYENKNVIFLLLSDELLIVTYRRSLSTMTLMIKKSLKLWASPIKLPTGQQIPYNEQQQQIPLHSTGMAILESTLAVTSNKPTILATVAYNLSKIPDIQEYRINKDNYNPSRIGNEEHTGHLEIKNPMVTIKDYASVQFEVGYHWYASAKGKFGDFVLCGKIGNLLANADDKLNILLWQSGNWEQIAGVINCHITLPKLWNIFKYSQQQIQQVQFVLDFIENQSKFPTGLVVKSLMQTSIKPKTTNDLNLAQITISQLIKQDRQKGGLKSYRSCSLREKKIVLEKERDDRQKLENYLEQVRLDKKEKPNNSLKNNAHKQITDTLAYLSLNHNETILKKGLLEEDLPAVRQLEKKLLASVAKDEKKSIVSYKTGQQSARTHHHRGLHKSVTAFSLQKLTMAKTLSTEIYEEMTEKLGIKNFNSKQLLQRLKIQKYDSIRKLKSISKEQKLPKIQKN